MTDAPAAAGTLVEMLRDDAAYNRDVAQLSERPVAAWQADLLESAQVADLAADALSACRAELAAAESDIDTLASHNIELQAAKEQSERLLAAAAKDAERLDWIAMHHPEFTDYGDRVEVKFIRNEAGDKSGYLAFTLREAIDAAILGDPK